MDEGREQTTGTVVKRRGILAAAGAAVAGIVAKQASQPVAANDAIWTMPYSATTTASANPLIEVWNQNTTSQVAYAVRGNTASPFAAGIFGGAFVDGGMGVLGNASDTGTSSIGVYGRAINDGRGVVGESRLNTGVQEQITAGSAANTVAVKGLNLATGVGGIGVVGQCDVTGGTGVKAVSAGGFPMVGVTTTGANANAGVLGVGTLGPGVQGQSYAGHGLVGTTSATDGIHTGLTGTVQPGSNAIAVRGTVAAGAVGYAGIFDGDVLVNGALRVFGSPKNAAVKHPTDNTYRLLYCEESPESWFADYGKGKLVNGRADIKLDPDFAALVHADDYHVFLTSHDAASKGLAVAATRPDGFAVQEHAGGTSGGTFSYRVVARRKDIGGERLATVSPPPPLKAVTPFTVPETPDLKQPTKKP